MDNGEKKTPLCIEAMDLNRNSPDTETTPQDHPYDSFTFSYLMPVAALSHFNTPCSPSHHFQDDHRTIRNRKQGTKSRLWYVNRLARHKTPMDDKEGHDGVHCEGRALEPET
jgi:hypothetical protein